MPSVKLNAHAVEKPWGRANLLPSFAQFETGKPIGEIWFDHSGDDAELLVKYLFTSEKLSVQVHPDDEAAQAAGYPRGKDEAWFIVDAEPDSTIALGPICALAPNELRAAAIDGSIVALLDWRPVEAGDFIYSPAGTIHAIGAGLTIVEVQQNLDLTYRLYDYGRPRELHLEQAAAVAALTPVEQPTTHDNTLLAVGPKFVIERLSHTGRELPEHTTALLVPLVGEGAIDGRSFHAGECWAINGDASILVPLGCTALLVYAGAKAR